MELQTNYVTLKPYEGRNQVDLTIAKEDNGYKSNYWLTFLQAKDKGLWIKKGSKSVSVFKGFEKFTEEVEKDGKKEIVERSAPLGSARVFNLDQTEQKEAVAV